MSDSHDQNKDELIKELKSQRDMAFELAMDFWLYGRLRSSKVKEKYDEAEAKLTDLENEIFCNEGVYKKI